MPKHPNEKYGSLLNVNALDYDPVLDFRDKVVKMRRLQTKYNMKGGLDLLYKTMDAEKEVDMLIFGKSARIDGQGYLKDDNRILEEDI